MQAQLGRPPRGRWSVAVRCACGQPQVIRTDPVLEDCTPFPTLYWLTCKALSKAVGRLEAGGFMAGLNDRLAGDPSLRAGLEAATARYVQERGDPPDGPLRHPGGGPDKVKCLHAHVAHELARGDNPVGRLALAELAWSDPAEGCV